MCLCVVFIAVGEENLPTISFPRDSLTEWKLFLIASSGALSSPQVGYDLHHRVCCR